MKIFYANIRIKTTKGAKAPFENTMFNSFRLSTYVFRLNDYLILLSRSTSTSIRPQCSHTMIFLCWRISL